MKRLSMLVLSVLLVIPVTMVTVWGGAVLAQAQPTAAAPPGVVTVSEIPFDSVTDFLKYSPDMNLGEVLGIAVNSKGRIAVLNHPGSPTSGPMYGNASTQLLEFDVSGKFIREVGRGVYGLGYGHGLRYDRYDNLWVVDKGVHTAVRFNPAGYVTLNLGRRPEGPDEPEWYHPLGAGEKAPVHQDSYFRGPTDVAFDSDDNIYISDGYTNSRVAKFDRNGNWVKSWGQRGPGGAHANENPGNLNTPHNIAIDRQNNVYVADRNNRRIQVFDRDGAFIRYLFLNAAYNKARQPVLGNRNPNGPDETQPWTICITNTPTQYLYTSDSEPGRIYKMTLDGKILGTLGESGRGPRQFNWIHAIACPSENELLVADMNNWRVQKVTLHPERMKPAATSSGQVGGVGQVGRVGQVGQVGRVGQVGQVGTAGAVGTAGQAAAAGQASARPDPRTIKLRGGRFRPLTWDEMTPAQRTMMEHLLAGPRGGTFEGPFNVLLRSPEMGDLAQQFGGATRFATTVPRKLYELAIILTARHWTAQFEWTAHKRGALQAGLSPAIVEAIAIGKRPASMAPDEEAVYNFASELLDTKYVSDATFNAAAKLLGERGVVELVNVMGWYGMVSMLLNVDRYPLPEGQSPELKPLQ